MRVLSIILLVIISACIIVIAVLARPERTGEGEFWLVVIWLLFLVFLNWAVSSYIFVKVGKNIRSTQFGILPSLNILVFVYSIISMGFLVFSWNISEFLILPNWHLIVQIIAFAGTSVVCVLMLIAAKGAAIEIPEDVKPKEELSVKLKQLIATLPEDKAELGKDLVRLRDFIQYSMPHTARIQNIENYNLLFSQIHELNFSNNDVTECLNAINKAINLAKLC